MKSAFLPGARMVAYLVLVCFAFSGSAWGAPAQKAAGDPVLERALQISASSTPYHLELQGRNGTLSRAALGSSPADSLPLVYLYTAPGPSGFSKHLAWFLGRSANQFALLWCYLDDDGSNFQGWLYRFPDNQLTTLKFSGTYQFGEGGSPSNPTVDLSLPQLPEYMGRDFTFGNWTPKSGTTDRLELRELSNGVAPLRSGQRGPVANTPSRPGPGQEPPALGGAVAKVLTGLQISPLHDLRVASDNGWRTGGWSELHALATDALHDPYYLILYSNSREGYAVDLKRAHLYVTDFGANVRFPTEGLNGADTEAGLLPQVRVSRFEIHEVSLTTSGKYQNPFNEVLAEADVVDPDNRHFTVPAYWDGGQTWRLRIAPTKTGEWTWRIRSNDAELNGQTGALECVSNETNRGYLQVNSSLAHRRHFSLNDGTPFYPVMLRDSVYYAHSSGPGGVTPLVTPAVTTGDASSPSPASFLAFQKHVDVWASRGFNRFVGAYLIPASFSLQSEPRNEGGAPFVAGDPDRINPGFFQWMDRRIAYCNEKGIVPDVGLGWPSHGLFTDFSDEQLRRLWRYAVARYAAYDVCWNLFGTEGAPTGIPSADQAAQFIELTRRLDPYKHPLAAMALPAAEFSPVIRHGVGLQVTASPRESQAESTVDVVTVAGGDVANLDLLGRVEKPVVLFEGPASRDAAASDNGMSPDVARYRLWETRSKNAYWVSDAEPGLTSNPDAETPSTRYLAYAAALFKRTHFSELEPHAEMLGGRTESPADQRRRKRAEAAAGIASPTTPPTGTVPTTGAILIPPPPTSIFVLAHTGWEYIVYFEHGGSVTLDLLEATGQVRLFWFNPRTGEYADAQGKAISSALADQQYIIGGAFRTFVAPDANDWVLYLTRH